MTAGVNNGRYGYFLQEMVEELFVFFPGIRTQEQVEFAARVQEVREFVALNQYQQRRVQQVRHGLRRANIQSLPCRLSIT